MKSPKTPIVISWLGLPEEHDYPAAHDYLSLIFENEKIEKLIAGLKNTDITHFKAKDIFRASKLSLLGVSNSHVRKDKKNIEKGTSLSPLLLVRDP